MERYEAIDISGDAGIRARGETMEELFVNMALGMYGLITDRESVSESVSAAVSVTHISLEGLLVSWLNELIFRFDTEGFIGKRIDGPVISSPLGSGGEAFVFNASLTGGIFDPERHSKGLLLKAATYHKLKVMKVGGLWQAEVIFDI